MWLVTIKYVNASSCVVFATDMILAASDHGSNPSFATIFYFYFLFFFCFCCFYFDLFFSLSFFNFNRIDNPPASAFG